LAASKLTPGQAVGNILALEVDGRDRKPAGRAMFMLASCMRFQPGRGMIHFKHRRPGLRKAVVSSPAPSTTTWRTPRATARCKASWAARLRTANEQPHMAMLPAKRAPRSKL